MTRRHARRAQLGAALLIMLAVLVLGVSWFTVSRLAAVANFTAAARGRNAETLGQAKAALIGYVAQRAARSGENSPGRLPCPEAPGSAGGPNEGVAAGNCTLPAVGRFPWRTLGIDKIVDAAAEPLWYAVSPGWALVPPGTSPLTIHSNTVGQLSVDGEPNAAVALLIAPGPAFSVQAAPGCAARVQSRGVLPPNVRDYLECENASFPADVNFTSRGPAGSFNDQIVKVTAADLLPAIEAAIAHRIEREIVPLLKSAYASAAWGASAANPVFPYAAPFSDPATSSYQGAAGTLRGLLPFTFSQGCTPATDPRCSTTLVNWNTTPAYAPVMTMTGASTPAHVCQVVNTSTIQCTGSYVAAAASVQLRLAATANGVAMALKQFDPGKITVQVRELPLSPWQSATAALSGQFNADDTVTIGAVANVAATPLASYAFEATAEIGVFADHPLLDASTASSTGWFVRNQWYRLTYYAIAPPHAASATAPRACTDVPLTCLDVANLAPTGKQRAILILAGRALIGQARPSANVADFLEFGNAATPAAFERQPVSTALAPSLKKPFNDRVVVLDANP
ncbi:MAG TPA: hypothetical protein VGP71_01305 [Burkholderiales bacterium]|jgi:hypothetical protein|nr:hypothetical protein [Burkholderiales bacterium]